MDKDIAKKIGLLKHRIISPVLMESGRSQMKYFEKMAKREFDVPGSGVKKIKATTMKGWLRSYRKFGYKSLEPSVRRDKGHSRKLSAEDWTKVTEFRKENIDLSVTLFYERARNKQLLGIPPISLSTVSRFIKKNKLHTSNSPKKRKKYEMSYFGELWVGDFCHGPKVRDGKRFKKAILLAIIDDYSRMIVGASFAFSESTHEIEEVFKNAILSYGLPGRIYVDNGPSFSSNYLAHACAQTGIGLVHSKPYDSPSRGKIERFFRTVRGRFLIDIKDNELSLEELNNRYSSWLRMDYHLKIHSSLGMRPIDRYRSSVEEYPLKRISLDQLSEYFMSSINRLVRKDSTVSLNSIYYEVPAAYIGTRVDIRHIQGGNRYYLYDDNRRICEIRPVDSKANAKFYRPTPRDNILNFHEEE